MMTAPPDSSSTSSTKDAQHIDGLTVFYVTMRFPGLSETFAGNDVLALTRGGVDVSVHSLRTARADAGRLLAKRGLTGIQVSHNGAASTLSGLVQMLKRPALAVRLVAWLVRYTGQAPTQFVRSLLVVPRAFDILAAAERRRPDVVHLFWGHYPALVAWLVRRALPNTVVSVFLGAHDLRSRYGGSGPIARDADVVWTHMAANVGAIRRLGVTHIGPKVAYRGVDFGRLRKVTADESKIAGRIVTAGRLVPSKGVGDVIEAFAQILKRVPGASLVVLGEGPERPVLERRAQELGVGEALTFLGHVDQDQAFIEMARAEVFLFMSKVESLPNVIKEAMACCCVCVTAETPGIDELVSDGENGFIVAQGAVALAAERVATTLADPALRQRMGSAARRHVEAKFDLYRTMTQYRTTWEELVQLRCEKAEVTSPTSSS